MSNKNDFKESLSIGFSIALVIAMFTGALIFFQYTTKVLKQTAKYIDQTGESVERNNNEIVPLPQDNTQENIDNTQEDIKYNTENNKSIIHNSDKKESDIITIDITGKHIAIFLSIIVGLVLLITEIKANLLRKWISIKIKAILKTRAKIKEDKRIRLTKQIKLNKKYDLDTMQKYLK